MALKEYPVDIGGIEHTIQLTEDDAKARGLTEKKPAAKQAKAPANKQAPAPATKQAAPAAAAPTGDGTASN